MDYKNSLSNDISDSTNVDINVDENGNVYVKEKWYSTKMK